MPKRLAVGVLLVVAIGGVAAVALVPGGAASKTALGLGVVAALIAASNYAESPDWEELEKDVRRLREIAEETPRPPRNRSGILSPLLFGFAMVWLLASRLRRRGKR